MSVDSHIAAMEKVEYDLMCVHVLIG